MVFYSAALEMIETVGKRRQTDLENLSLLNSIGHILARQTDEMRPDIPSDGTVMMPEQVMILAGRGFSHVQVRRRPQVAMISTGRELVSSPKGLLPVGQDSEGRHQGQGGLQSGQQVHQEAHLTRISTGLYLESAIGFCKGDLIFVEGIGDDLSEFNQSLRRALAIQPDVILVMGEISESLAGEGARIHFDGVAVQPGGSLVFGEFEEGGPVVFGISPTPALTKAAVRFFVEPYLRAVQGLPMEAPIWARLSHCAVKPEGLVSFCEAELILGTPDCPEAKVRSLDSREWSDSIPCTTLMSRHANSWVMLADEGSQVEAGTWVKVWPLFSSELGGKLSSVR